MNCFMVKWFDVLYYFAMRFEDFRYLLSQFSDYSKTHQNVKSVSRIAYYVLRENYSIEYMKFLRASYYIKSCL